MSTSSTLREMFRSPLMRSEAAGLEPTGFLRQVLAEAAFYGMPPQLVATLDDVAAILGFHRPMTIGQASQVAAPLSQWRTSRYQPSIEMVTDVESLAYKQRALIAFGAMDGHMVGTAEIVFAMGNVDQDFYEKILGTEPEYRDLYYWAAVDVLATMRGVPKATIWKIREWPVIEDDDVLKPDGRLFKVYTELATYMRRTAIDTLKDDHPRALLQPIAEAFLESHQKVLAQLTQQARSDPEYLAVVERLQQMVKMTGEMFPELKGQADAVNPPKGA